MLWRYKYTTRGKQTNQGQARGQLPNQGPAQALRICHTPIKANRKRSCPIKANRKRYCHTPIKARRKCSFPIKAKREQYCHMSIKAKYYGSCPTKCKRKRGFKCHHGHTTIKTSQRVYQGPARAIWPQANQGHARGQLPNQVQAQAWLQAQSRPHPHQGKTQARLPHQCPLLDLFDLDPLPDLEWPLLDLEEWYLYPPPVPSALDPPGRWKGRSGVSAQYKHSVQ